MRFRITERTEDVEEAIEVRRKVMENHQNTGNS